MKTLLLAALALYRAFARPFLPPACRFHPSCGDYAAEAVASRGAFAGTILTLRRLLRCHPFTDGGHDPVPHHG
jgi:putative membrane protein insertion efficiency factor